MSSAPAAPDVRLSFHRNPIVTPEQILLVRASWPVVVANSDAMATRFYEHLFDIDPDAARLFSHVDMAAQRRKLIQALAVVVGALDDPDRLLPEIGELGKRHARYGVEHQHFNSVGEALLSALADSLGDAFDRDVRQAWAEAYALVASVMRRALVRSAEQPAVNPATAS